MEGTIDLVSAEEGMREEVDVVRSPSEIGGGAVTRRASHFELALVYAEARDL